MFVAMDINIFKMRKLKQNIGFQEEVYIYITHAYTVLS